MREDWHLINESELLMMRKQVLDDSRVFDELVMNFSIFGVNLTWRAEKPLQKGIGASEVGSFNLTSTSPEPHFYLT